MIRRLVSLGILVAILVGGDVAARGYVSSAVSARAQQQAPPGTTVSASVGGFPFIPPLLTAGRVSDASVHIENLPAKVLVFASIDIDLKGVHLDRQRLIKSHKARITKIDHGTVRAVVTQDALSNALHMTVKMTGGQLVLTIAGVDVPVTPRMVGTQLTLTGAVGRTVTLAIPSSAYVPCVSDVVVQDGKMQLSCTINHVPPALLDAAQTAGGN